MEQQSKDSESFIREGDSQQKQRSCTAKERLCCVLAVIVAGVTLMLIWCLSDVIKTKINHVRVLSGEGAVICLYCSAIIDREEYFTFELEGNSLCCQNQSHLTNKKNNHDDSHLKHLPTGAHHLASEERHKGPLEILGSQLKLQNHSKDGMLVNLNSNASLRPFRDGLHLMSGWMFNLTNQAFRKGSISLDQSLTSIIIPYESVYLISYEIVIRCASAMSDSSDSSHTVSHALLRFRGAGNTPKDSTTLRESSVLLGPSQLYVKCFSLQLAMPLKLFKGDRLAIAMSVPDLLVKENNEHFFSVYDLGW